MVSMNVVFASYTSIILGIVLIAFHGELTEFYEKFAARNGSAFPRFITITRLIIGGLVFIGVGIARLVLLVGARFQNIIVDN